MLASVIVAAVGAVASGAIADARTPTDTRPAARPPSPRDAAVRRPAATRTERVLVVIDFDYFELEADGRAHRFTPSGAQYAGIGLIAGGVLLATLWADTPVAESLTGSKAWGTFTPLRGGGSLGAHLSARHDHHGGPRCDVGHGHDGHSDRGRGRGLRLRGRRSNCTTECIGLHAAKRGTRFEALEPIRQGVRARFGTIGEGVARGLRLRHDHGSNYLADDFQQEVAFFGIESSPSFVREPEGNGVAERFIRTLKENLLWVRSFDTIEELRLALLEFKRTYNEQWMLEKYHYQSPAQVRRDFVGLDAAA